MILGILGQAGSGKDTMADYLVKNYRFNKVALADPLKRICKEVYRFSDNQLWGPSEERNKPDPRYPRADGTFLTPREALQKLGTEWGRSNYEDTWIDYGINAAARILAGEYYDQPTGFSNPPLKWKIMRVETFGVSIPDVRFKNELAKVHDAGGFVIKLKASWAPELTAGIKDHASEMEQKTIKDEDVDKVLEVPKGLPNYYAAIDELIAELAKRAGKYIK